MRRTAFTIVFLWCSAILTSCGSESGSFKNVLGIGSKDTSYGYLDQLIYRFYLEEDSSYLHTAYDYVETNELLEKFDPKKRESYAILGVLIHNRDFKSCTEILVSNRKELSPELLLGLYDCFYLERIRVGDSATANAYLDSSLVMLNNIYASLDNSSPLVKIINIANHICVRYGQDSLMVYLETVEDEGVNYIETNFTDTVDFRWLILDQVECSLWD